MSERTLDLAVLASGRGSNLLALCDAIEAGRCRARIVMLVTDRQSAGAIEIAEARSIPVHVIRARDYDSRMAWDEALAARLATAAPDLVVLAGFMRVLGAPVLSRFGGRIINVHPSLLPAFPGMDGPGQAITARVRISGCTVHRVDAGIDTGEILAQAAVVVAPEDDSATLHARIQRVEHRLLPSVVDMIARGTLTTARGNTEDVLVSPSREPGEPSP